MFTFQALAKGLLTFGAFIVVATGCKKDPVSSIPRPTEPLPVIQELVIDFYNTGVQLINVETSKILIRDANNNIKKWIPMHQRTAALYLSVADLPAGQYSVEMTVRTKIETDKSAREYAILKTIRLPLQQNFHLHAPIGNFAEEWFKRAVLFAKSEEAVAVIAMDPRDAFYEVSFKAAAWEKSILQRTAINDNVLAANMESAKNLGGIVSFAEYTAFHPFTQEMRNKSWTKAAISLYLLHKDGHKVYLDFSYNK